MERRVVLVTGSAGGIGRATVRRLSARGDRIVAVDSAYGGGLGSRRSGVVSESADGAVVEFLADVRDRSALQGAVDVALERWGRVDAAVAAAAVIAGGRPLWETSDADLDALIGVDVMGVWNTATVAVPAMLSGPDPRGCRFVAIASAAASHGLFGLAGYNAAKHAVVGIVKGLAADLVGTGVTACAVSPGSTRTPMLAKTAELYALPSVEEFSRNQLIGRLLDPDDVAAVVAFCCSLEAAAINGTVVHADGGFVP